MLPDEIRQSMQNPFQIDRRSNLGRKALLNEYVNKNLPVILTDAAKDWPAIGKWTPEFFKTHYGHLTKELDGRLITLAEQVDRVLASTPEDPAPYPYCVEMTDYFPDLLKDIEPAIVFGRMDRVRSPLMPKALMHGTPIHEIFFGGNGSAFPFVHFDALYLGTNITQIYGAKDFVLYRPEDGPYMYPRPDNEKFSRVTNVFDPDLERFPLFAKAKPYFATLNAGETIYFPCGWWHTTVTHCPSISSGRVVLNTLNYDMYLRDKYKRWSQRSKFKAKVAFGIGKGVGSLMSAFESLH